MRLASYFRLFLLLFLPYLGACSAGGGGSQGTTSVSEETYCSTTHTYSTFHTITGTANYKRRLFTVCGLGSVDTTDYPIRFAEVQVLDSTGAVVQCAETDSSGVFTFKVPDDGATYTIKVNSRAYNSSNKASVLQDPTNNTHYSISETFTSDADKTVTTLVAQADENLDSQVRGGAFNILDDIYKANTYLKNNSSGAFAVTAKIQAYWKKGVNPVTYFGGNAQEGVSFYVPGTNKLYILGGIDGDIAVNDTDHFDDSVIIHEFGHFVEDNYSVSNSPGGSHYGLYIIDPRLAWSEGFADFFQAAIRSDSTYKDTSGHDNSTAATTIGSCGASTAYLFNYNIETNTPALDTLNQGSPGATGEGNFREFAITRFLWDMIDPATGETGDTVQANFSDFYTVYTNGFKNGENFKEMGLFLKVQATAGPNISSLYNKSDEMMLATRANYGAVDNAATPNNSGSASCQYTIQAKDNRTDLKENGSFVNSNQFSSNDFYYYYHPGGTFSVSLAYTPTGNADLDLYIYRDNYTYGSSSSILAYSSKPSSGAQADNGMENISVSAPAGFYMVNVQYYTGNTRNGGVTPYDSTTYTISIGGNLICK